MPLDLLAAGHTAWAARCPPDPPGPSLWGKAGAREALTGRQRCGVGGALGSEQRQWDRAPPGSALTRGHPTAPLAPRQYLSMLTGKILFLISNGNFLAPNTCCCLVSCPCVPQGSAFSSPVSWLRTAVRPRVTSSSHLLPPLLRAVQTSAFPISHTAAPSHLGGPWGCARVPMSAGTGGPSPHCPPAGLPLRCIQRCPQAGAGGVTAGGVPVASHPQGPDQPHEEPLSLCIICCTSCDVGLGDAAQCCHSPPRQPLAAGGGAQAPTRR